MAYTDRPYLGPKRQRTVEHYKRRNQKKKARKPHKPA